MKRWHSEPATVYAWLRELANLEDRFAILSGSVEHGWQTELIQRATKRTLILGRHLEPPAAPANAA